MNRPRQILLVLLDGLRADALDTHPIKAVLVVPTLQNPLGSCMTPAQRKRLAQMASSHDVAVIAAMAHDVMVMKDGAVVEQGSVAQVLDAPQHPYTQRLVAAAGLEASEAAVEP